MADKKLKYSAEEIDSLLQKVEEGDVDVNIGVLPIEGGHRVTINGKAFDVMDGAVGAQGPEGPKGDPGEKAVTTQVGGFFTLAVDHDGNLWAYSEDDIVPVFEYDPDTGELYVVTEEE